MKSIGIKQAVIAGIFVCIAMLHLGCGSSGGLDDIGGGISLSASPKVIPADGKSSSVITATITSTGGVAVPIGTQVTFQTTLGRFSNGSTTYKVTIGNSTGTLTVTLIAGTSEGTAEVTCFAGGASQSIKITIGNVTVSTIQLTASPLTIAADGVSSSAITAVVTNSLGEPADMGTSAQFSTNLGFFSNNSKSYQTMTDSSGTALATLYAGTSIGVAQVTCTVGSVQAVVFVEFTTDPSPQPGAVSSISLTANPLSILADGTSSSAITATLTDKNGTPVMMGTSVTFSTNLGTFSNNSKTYTTSTSGENGTAQATLFAGTTPGSAKVTASSGGVSSIIYIEINSF
jgi:adhesin/invasin